MLHPDETPALNAVIKVGRMLFGAQSAVTPIASHDARARAPLSFLLAASSVSLQNLD